MSGLHQGVHSDGRFAMRTDDIYAEGCAHPGLLLTLQLRVLTDLEFSAQPQPLIIAVTSHGGVLPYSRTLLVSRAQSYGQGARDCS